MTTTAVFGTAIGKSGSLGSRSIDYQRARAGYVVSGAWSTAYTHWVGQRYTTSGTDYWCHEGFETFDTSAITGTYQTAVLKLYITSGGDYSDDQEFTLQVRQASYGSGLTTADWLGGAALLKLPLLGELASSSFTEDAYNEITLSGLAGTLVGDELQIVLCASTHADGTAISNSADHVGYVEIWRSDKAGTTNDPRLDVTWAGNPTNCTITAPAYGSYDGTINLTAYASDPQTATVRYHWDYSTDNGANWSACPNSPSSYTAQGTSATITLDVTAFSIGDIIDLRVRAYDGALYSFSYATVRIARSTQVGVSIYRTAGTAIVAHSASGIVIDRPVSAASSLRFMIDNYDAAEGNIADDDELVLYVPYYTVGGVGSFTWRGFVTTKRTGDMLEVTAQDIAHRFNRMRVTRSDLVTSTVGVVIKAIVENPTGSHATGIVATCDEVEDPLVAGTYLSVATFDGAGRMLSDWLQELASWTGCQWYVYYDTTDSLWRLRWFDPTENTAWATACLDALDWADESSTQAAMLSQPTVTTDLTGYINRVWYVTDATTTPWTYASVETAAVTAGTEEPLEMMLDTQKLDAAAAESLANAYLAAYSKVRETIDGVTLYGIRNIDLDSDVTVTLTPNAISAADYPLQRITYNLLEQGHTTTLQLGDSTLTETTALQRLVRRLTQLSADVRA